MDSTTFRTHSFWGQPVPRGLSTMEMLPLKGLTPSLQLMKKAIKGHNCSPIHFLHQVYNYTYLHLKFMFLRRPHKFDKISHFCFDASSIKLGDVVKLLLSTVYEKGHQWLQLQSYLLYLLNLNLSNQFNFCS